MKKKLSLKKEVREWAIFAMIIGVLYFTGWYTEVAAFAQRVVLTTGIMTADLQAPENNETIDYSFKVQTLEGKIVAFEQFKGKVIFLNEWATWCAPCIAEMPGIQSLYEKVGDHENIVFVMLTLDTDMNKVNRFITKKEFTFPVYTASSAVPKEFRSPTIPTTYVISKDGKIASKTVGMAKYDTQEFESTLLKLAGN